MAQSSTQRALLPTAAAASNADTGPSARWPEPPAWAQPAYRGAERVLAPRRRAALWHKSRLHALADRSHRRQQHRLTNQVQFLHQQRPLYWPHNALPEGSADRGACTPAAAACVLSTSRSATAAPCRTSHSGCSTSRHSWSQSAWKGHLQPVRNGGGRLAHVQLQHPPQCKPPCVLHQLSGSTAMRVSVPVK